MVNYKFLQQVKVVSTDNLAQTLLAILREAGYQRPLFVMDKFLLQSEIVQEAKAKLVQNSFEVNTFTDIVPDPPLEVVDQGVAVFKESQSDAIVAIGGGSSIDVARGINIVRVNGGNIRDYALGNREIGLTKGLIAIPTTSGTGSEMSNALVLTDQHSEQKLAILSDNAVSEYAILNPDLVLSLPKKMTIATGLDAFSHAAEGYLSKLSSPITDAICEKVMFLLYHYLPRAVADGNDRIAREKVMVAACLAGWMLNNAGTNIGHSSAHILGSKYHIVHGEAVAYALPGVLQLAGQAMPNKVHEIGQILDAEYSKNLSDQEMIMVVSKRYKVFRDHILGLHPFADYGIKQDELLAHVDEIKHEQFAGNTPLTLNKENVTTFLKQFGAR
ncbi:iron-containing alcohol dehydrogenase [Loigolactobacillus rennini]|uniref:Alcohol dehydrogenase, iron-dependent n=1 Tax=Loigolactobacillus rennini DSM 20253 TaxID=1423796 RepID=A0A0R2D523_9LACO|nr:iron-containing alcohol dehydrogenase [Loigolactobacillus rennini]KRM95657.1 alcohol dehydrogenase, iron-dependent [Loigolactobacillus rennini DSM 20253]